MDNKIVYLDNCVFNRPFDDQRKIDIKFEAEAKIHIQWKILKGEIKLIWSYIIEFENAQNPFLIRKKAIYKWKKKALYNILETEQIVNNALSFEKIGFKAKDALHMACAIEGKADYFITTDKSILNKTMADSRIYIINPVNFLMKLEKK